MMQSALYESLGGDAGMRAAVDVFYARVTGDETLAPFFVGIDLDRLRAHQRSFLSAALGGPELFTGRPLEHAHAGLGITEDHFDRLVDHLASTLGDLGVAPAAVAEVRERLDLLRSRVVVG